MIFTCTLAGRVLNFSTSAPPSRTSSSAAITLSGASSHSSKSSTSSSLPPSRLMLRPLMAFLGHSKLSPSTTNLSVPSPLMTKKRRLREICQFQRPQRFEFKVRQLLKNDKVLHRMGAYSFGDLCPCDLS